MGVVTQIFSGALCAPDVGTTLSQILNPPLLIVKPEYEEQAHTLFTGSDIEVTTRGHRHLGAVVVSAAFKDEYVRKHVDEWVNEVRCLSDIAQTQPHAAYSAFVHGLTGHWSHIMRTIPDIGNPLATLENVIH